MSGAGTRLTASSTPSYTRWTTATTRWSGSPASPGAPGKVGMYGGSYVGATQWLAAKSKPPSLTAIAPVVTASDYHEGWAWQGGAFELGFNLSWTMGGLTAANWANLKRRLLLPDEQLDRLIDSKDNLTQGFLNMPMQDLPDLKGNLAPTTTTGWPTPSTTTTGSGSPSKSLTPRSPSPRSTSEAGTTSFSAGPSATSRECRRWAPPRRPGADRG